MKELLLTIEGQSLVVSPYRIPNTRGLAPLYNITTIWKACRSLFNSETQWFNKRPSSWRRDNKKILNYIGLKYNERIYSHRGTATHSTEFLVYAYIRWLDYGLYMQNFSAYERYEHNKIIGGFPKQKEFRTETIFGSVLKNTYLWVLIYLNNT